MELGQGAEMLGEGVVELGQVVGEVLLKGGEGRGETAATRHPTQEVSGTVQVREQDPCP